MPLSKWGAAAAGISQGLQNVAQIQRMGQVKRATEREEADYASKNAPVDFNEWSGRMGEDVRPIIQETAISLGVNPKQFTRADAEKVYTAINSERIAQRLSSIRRRTLSGQISAEPDPNRAIELQRQLEDLNNADKGYMEARRIAAIENRANQTTSPTVHKMYKTVNGIDMMSEDGGQTWGRRWNPKEGGGSGDGGNDATTDRKRTIAGLRDRAKQIRLELSSGMNNPEYSDKDKARDARAIQKIDKNLSEDIRLIQNGKEPHYMDDFSTWMASGQTYSPTIKQEKPPEENRPQGLPPGAKLAPDGKYYVPNPKGGWLPLKPKGKPVEKKPPKNGGGW